MTRKIPPFAILAVICIVAALLLATVNLLTKDIIAANQAGESMKARLALLPGSKTFEDLEDGVSVGKDDAGNVMGYAGVGVATGFGGEVEVTVVTLPDGTLTGVSVGGANFAESAGFGANAKEPEFQDQFAGKTAPLALTANGGEIDGLAGATITSKAVIKAANSAVEKIAAVAGFTVAEDPNAASNVESKGDGKYAAAADGFGGPVKVFLTLDENNTITAIEIGDNQFNETEYLGERALEPAFQNQFIGKTLPVAYEDVDAIAGATITTKAVVNAINMISDAVNGVERKPDVEDKGDGKYAAAADGFGGPVKVFLTVNENKTITAIEIGDNQFNETEYLGERALEPAFQNQFIGKTLPVAFEEVDAIAGATITTKAVVNAINMISDYLK